MSSARKIYKLVELYSNKMFDMKISTAIIVDMFLGISGILFWFSNSFAQALGVIGFIKRFFAGIVCFIILAVVTFIATRK